MSQYNSALVGRRVACHTDNVIPGGTFFAIRGTQQNGIAYISQALARGATRIVVDTNEKLSQAVLADIEQYRAELIRVEDIRMKVGEFAARAYEYPAKKLKIIGITGTKGKSTTAFLLEHVLRVAGYKTALVSTVYNSINGIALQPTGMTTPLPDYLHAFFALCVQEDVEWVVCEAAAQAFTMKRFAGIKFDGAIFTNFSHEHGEFYSTMDKYFAAKKEIISYLKPAAPLLLNQDDAAVAGLSSMYPFSSFFSIDRRFKAPSLLGQFNEYNSSAAACCAQLCAGVSEAVIVSGFATFTQVPGRLNLYYLANGARVVIDYAHNPSSFEAVLGEMRKLTDHLIVVFGCGGDRDRTKRPVMGKIAMSLADEVVLTSDNSRSEETQDIIDDICADNEGICANVFSNVDRRAAIVLAIEKRSRPGSLIALLGKGPEEYQIINGERYLFSEKNIISRYL